MTSDVYAQDHQDVDNDLEHAINGLIYAFRNLSDSVRTLANEAALRSVSNMPSACRRLQIAIVGLNNVLHANVDTAENNVLGRIDNVPAGTYVNQQWASEVLVNVQTASVHAFEALAIAREITDDLNFPGIRTREEKIRVLALKVTDCELASNVRPPAYPRMSRVGIILR